MKKIWKYEIPIAEEFVLDLPFGADILAVHTQRDKPMIWAMVDSFNSIENRKFSVQATGPEFKEYDKVYIGTFYLAQESLVFHLFEILDGEKV